MSKVTQTSNDGRVAINQYDTEKIFIFDNKYLSATGNNATYSEATWPCGTVLGRVSATQEVVPLKSGASDGSQFPVGILKKDHTIDASSTKEVYFCVGGDVNEAGLVFDGSDDLDTVVDGRSLRDRLASDTVGIRLITVDELTGPDNE